jgi:hypothetical protein
MPFGVVVGLLVGVVRARRSVRAPDRKAGHGQFGCPKARCRHPSRKPLYLVSVRVCEHGVYVEEDACAVCAAEEASLRGVRSTPSSAELLEAAEDFDDDDHGFVEFDPDHPQAVWEAERERSWNAARRREREARGEFDEAMREADRKWREFREQRGHVD